MALLQQSPSRPLLAVRGALNDFASARPATIPPFWSSFKHVRISGIVVAIISGTRTLPPSSIMTPNAGTAGFTSVGCATQRAPSISAASACRGESAGQPHPRSHRPPSSRSSTWCSREVTMDGLPAIPSTKRGCRIRSSRTPANKVVAVTFADGSLYVYDDTGNLFRVSGCSCRIQAGIQSRRDRTTLSSASSKVNLLRSPR
jgi:hypothetical protein